MPQLFCAPTLRCAEVAGRLVLLDLTAGVYDVVDEIGTAMWAQLARPPHERDVAVLADEYGVPAAAVEADIAEFAAAQVAAGRLVRTPQADTPRDVLAARRRPTLVRALRERAAVERALRRGFASAYRERTQPIADTTPPRAELRLVTQRFRTAEGIYPARQAPLDCLPRSLALTRFLRTAGWPAQHVIGVALYPFEAHAWVELDGVALNESTSVLRRFTVIQQA
ncbi:lasso peptide biosynthesis B2 protein [Mycobacterium sp. UM_Kg1]|uniref:lasso peptide biosynthesis B2 protein n=1 Tax=Mycobacterium sp. UM_Kg1 TaxID=1545691 RepID=UPI0006977FE6|nr:lasso peptide biosynthesis B2 protein [Mycobacterium sp. UM_Kg1]